MPTTLREKPTLHEKCGKYQRTGTHKNIRSCSVAGHLSCSTPRLLKEHTCSNLHPFVQDQHGLRDIDEDCSSDELQLSGLLCTSSTPSCLNEARVQKETPNICRTQPGLKGLKRHCRHVRIRRVRFSDTVGVRSCCESYDRSPIADISKVSSAEMRGMYREKLNAIPTSNWSIDQRVSFIRHKLGPPERLSWGGGDFGPERLRLSHSPPPSPQVKANPPPVPRMVRIKDTTKGSAPLSAKELYDIL
jgi:hypothetical protein